MTSLSVFVYGVFVGIGIVITLTIFISILLGGYYLEKIRRGEYLLKIKEISQDITLPEWEKFYQTHPLGRVSRYLPERFKKYLVDYIFVTFIQQRLLKFLGKALIEDILPQYFSNFIYLFIFFSVQMFRLKLALFGLGIGLILEGAGFIQPLVFIFGFLLYMLAVYIVGGLFRKRIFMIGTYRGYYLLIERGLRNMAEGRDIEIIKEDWQKLRKAFEFLMERTVIHKNNNSRKSPFRKNGDLAVIHEVAICHLLLDWQVVDPRAYITTFLHDLVEDGKTTLEEIEVRFGSEIANCVEALTIKLPGEEGQELEKRWRKDFYNLVVGSPHIKYGKKIEYPYFLALVKLADRTHNIQTIGALEWGRQLANLEETVFLIIYGRLVGIQSELNPDPLCHVFPERMLTSENFFKAVETIEEEWNKAIERLKKNKKGCQEEVIAIEAKMEMVSYLGDMLEKVKFIPDSTKVGGGFTHWENLANRAKRVEELITTIRAYERREEEEAYKLILGEEGESNLFKQALEDEEYRSSSSYLRDLRERSRILGEDLEEKFREVFTDAFTTVVTLEELMEKTWPLFLPCAVIIGSRESEDLIPTVKQNIGKACRKIIERDKEVVQQHSFSAHPADYLPLANVSRTILNTIFRVTFLPANFFHGLLHYLFAGQFLSLVNPKAWYGIFLGEERVTRGPPWLPIAIQGIITFISFVILPYSFVDSLTFITKFILSFFYIPFSPNISAYIFLLHWFILANSVSFFLELIGPATLLILEKKGLNVKGEKAVEEADLKLPGFIAFFKRIANLLHGERILSRISEVIPLYVSGTDEEIAKAKEKLEVLFTDYYNLVVRLDRQDAGHGANHLKVVAEYAELLAERLGMSSREVRLSWLAGWLHDLERPTDGQGHSIKSAQKAKQVLEGLEEDDRNRVLHAIRSHSVDYELSIIYMVDNPDWVLERLKELPRYGGSQFDVIMERINNLDLDEYLVLTQEITFQNKYTSAVIEHIEAEDNIELVVRLGDLLERITYTEIWRRNLSATRITQNPCEFLEYWKIRLNRDRMILFGSSEGRKLRRLIGEEIIEFSIVESYYTTLEDNPEFLQAEFERARNTLEKDLLPEQWLEELRREFSENPCLYTRYVEENVALGWFYGWLREVIKDKLNTIKRGLSSIKRLEKELQRVNMRSKKYRNMQGKLEREIEKINRLAQETNTILDLGRVRKESLGVERDILITILVEISLILDRVSSRKRFVELEVLLTKFDEIIIGASAFYYKRVDSFFHLLVRTDILGDEVFEVGITAQGMIEQEGVALPSFIADSLNSAIRRIFSRYGPLMFFFINKVRIVPRIDNDGSLAKIEGGTLILSYSALNNKFLLYDIFYHEMCEAILALIEDNIGIREITAILMSFRQFFNPDFESQAYKEAIFAIASEGLNILIKDIYEQLNGRKNTDWDNDKLITDTGELDLTNLIRAIVCILFSEERYEPHREAIRAIPLQEIKQRVLGAEELVQGILLFSKNIAFPELEKIAKSLQREQNCDYALGRLRQILSKSLPAISLPSFNTLAKELAEVLSRAQIVNCRGYYLLTLNRESVEEIKTMSLEVIRAVKEGNAQALKTALQSLEELNPALAEFLRAAIKYEKSRNAVLLLGKLNELYSEGFERVIGWIIVGGKRKELESKVRQELEKTWGVSDDKALREVVNKRRKVEKFLAILWQEISQEQMPLGAVYELAPQEVERWLEVLNHYEETEGFGPLKDWDEEDVELVIADIESSYPDVWQRVKVLLKMIGPRPEEEREKKVAQLLQDNPQELGDEINSLYREKRDDLVPILTEIFGMLLSNSDFIDPGFRDLINILSFNPFKVIAGEYDLVLRVIMNPQIRSVICEGKPEWLIELNDFYKDDEKVPPVNRNKASMVARIARRYRDRIQLREGEIIDSADTEATSQSLKADQRRVLRLDSLEEEDRIEIILEIIRRAEFSPQVLDSLKSTLPSHTLDVPDKEWFTVVEVAEILGVNRGTVINMCKRGQLGQAEKGVLPSHVRKQWWIPRQGLIAQLSRCSLQEAVNILGATVSPFWNRLQSDVSFREESGAQRFGKQWWFEHTRIQALRENLDASVRVEVLFDFLIEEELTFMPPRRLLIELLKDWQGFCDRSGIPIYPCLPLEFNLISPYGHPVKIGKIGDLNNTFVRIRWEDFNTIVVWLRSLRKAYQENILLLSSGEVPHYAVKIRRLRDFKEEDLEEVIIAAQKHNIKAWLIIFRVYKSVIKTRIRRKGLKENATLLLCGYYGLIKAVGAYRPYNGRGNGFAFTQLADVYINYWLEQRVKGEGAEEVKRRLVGWINQGLNSEDEQIVQLACVLGEEFLWLGVDFNLRRFSIERIFSVFPGETRHIQIIYRKIDEFYDWLIHLKIRIKEDGWQKMEKAREDINAQLRELNEVIEMIPIPDLPFGIGKVLVDKLRRKWADLQKEANTIFRDLETIAQRRAELQEVINLAEELIDEFEAVKVSLLQPQTAGELSIALTGARILLEGRGNLIDQKIKQSKEYLSSMDKELSDRFNLITTRLYVVRKEVRRIVRAKEISLREKEDYHAQVAQSSGLEDKSEVYLEMARLGIIDDRLAIFVVSARIISELIEEGQDIETLALVLLIVEKLRLPQDAKEFAKIIRVPIPKAVAAWGKVEKLVSRYRKVSLKEFYHQVYFAVAGEPSTNLECVGQAIDILSRCEMITPCEKNILGYYYEAGFIPPDGYEEVLSDILGVPIKRPLPRALLALRQELENFPRFKEWEENQSLSFDSRENMLHGFSEFINADSSGADITGNPILVFLEEANHLRAELKIKVSSLHASVNNLANAKSVDELTKRIEIVKVRKEEVEILIEKTERLTRSLPYRYSALDKSLAWARKVVGRASSILSHAEDNKYELLKEEIIKGLADVCMRLEEAMSQLNEVITERAVELYLRRFREDIEQAKDKKKRAEQIMEQIIKRGLPENMVGEVREEVDNLDRLIEEAREIIRERQRGLEEVKGRRYVSGERVEEKAQRRFWLAYEDNDGYNNGVFPIVVRVLERLDRPQGWIAFQLILLVVTEVRLQRPYQIYGDRFGEHSSQITLGEQRAERLIASESKGRIKNLEELFEEVYKAVSLPPRL